MVGDSPDIVGEGSISDLGDLEGWWNNHAIVVWSFALFGCFLLNVILLLAFLIRPSLRTISNRFVMNLTVSNLLVCAIMNPLLIMDAVSTSSNSSILDSAPVLNICSMSEGAMAVVTTSSVFSVLLIAVDQYFAVMDPLRYRARVDKLKCGILILSTWMISIVFGFLAFFNSNPQSLWLFCISKEQNSLNISTESTLTILENKTNNNELNISAIPEIVETINLNDNIDLIENTTVIFDTLIDDTITYGFIYAIVYTIFAYFIPFIAVCWIYVTIYVAAHRNSERARRSGSRPILSSASFTEEQNGPSRIQRLQADTIEDFRKLPKISSLSSIDETSETMQPTGQLSRRRSFASSIDMDASSPPEEVEDKKPSRIVFTVGPQRVEVSQSRSTDQHLPHKYDVLASSLLILAAYISPLLFGYRSKRVKRELRRFFCFRRELSYKNNRSLMAKKVLRRRHSSNLSHFEMDHKYNIFSCMYGKNRWPKEKVQFVQVPDTALAVETCRSSFSSGASTQISSTSTEEC